jgi:hypothetical protein
MCVGVYIYVESERERERERERYNICGKVLASGFGYHKKARRAQARERQSYRAKERERASLSARMCGKHDRQ